LRVVYVLIGINGPSDSVEEFALKNFEHDIFMSQLSVSKPVNLFYNDAWRNKSELYFFSQGSSAYSFTNANLTSRAASFGYFFQLWQFFLIIKFS
jgi:hypothetical protein